MSRQPTSPGTPPAALTHLAVTGYRSLQQLMLQGAGLTVVCGANGRQEQPLSLAGADRRRREQPVQGNLRREGARLRLGFAGETLSYAIELGYRADDQTSAFVLDPEIKREWIWAGGPFHPRSLLVQRCGRIATRTPSSPMAPCATCCWRQPCAAGLSPQDQRNTGRPTKC